MPAPLATPPPQNEPLSLVRLARFPDLRVLAWSGEHLYASRGYDLLRATTAPGQLLSNDLTWQRIGSYHPAWWRNITAGTRLGSRLLREGFHALAVLPSGGVVAAVPGAIITLRPGDKDFRVTHRITRGTRPLHIAFAPDGKVFWGEYFDNASRDEVHIYASGDQGETWQIAYTFPKSAIRHVHNIVHDPWGDCFWVMTGDYGDECRILRASCDFHEVEVVLQGNQQARAVAVVPNEDGLYFSSDTPLEPNYIYHLDRSGKVSQLAAITSSSIYGCRVGGDVFFSTMVEPSAVNPDQYVRIYGSHSGQHWQSLSAWTKDPWPMRYFQYGNAFLPNGKNSTPYLAVTTVAVNDDDMATSIYSVNP